MSSPHSPAARSTPPDRPLRRPPASQVARFSTPVAAKTSAMPAHNGLCPDDRDGLEDRRKPAIQLDEEQAIAVREMDPTAHLAPQHSQLMAERGNLRFKSAFGPEAPRFKRRYISAAIAPTLSDSVIESKRTRFAVRTGSRTRGESLCLGSASSKQKKLRRCRSLFTPPDFSGDAGKRPRSRSRRRRRT